MQKTCKTKQSHNIGGEAIFNLPILFFFFKKKKRKALKKLCFTVTERKITPNSQSSPQNVQYNKGSSTSNQKTETEILQVMKFLPPTCRKKQKKTITQYFK